MQCKTLFRYRPRIVTLMVCAAVLALMVLSNLTYDEETRRLDDVGKFMSKSYGWPLVWHRYVYGDLQAPIEWVRGDIGWYCSPFRLAANVGLWLAMLTAATVATEWLLRRYRPRLQWRLRSMLFVTALTSAFLAWFVAVAERASVEDNIFSRRTHGTLVGPMEFRWGPKWLTLVGADRYRRWTSFATLKLKAGEDADLVRLALVKRLPKLRHLTVNVDHLTPDIANALSELRHLQGLAILERDESCETDYRSWPAALSAIGKMTWLEFLHMEEPAHRGSQLAHLSTVTGLKSLRITGAYGYDESGLVADDCLKAVGTLGQLEYLGLENMAPSANGFTFLSGLTRLVFLNLSLVPPEGVSKLVGLPVLPHLEAVAVDESAFGDSDLRRLARLPCLKAIELYETQVTSEGLANFAGHCGIEELVLHNDLVSADSLAALSQFSHLQSLHLGRNVERGNPRWARLTLDDGDEVKVLGQDIEQCLQALRALKDARPGIRIDGDTSAISAIRQNQMWPERSEMQSWCDERWLPAPNFGWMTPADVALFNIANGWADFYGAGIRDMYGHLRSVSF
ncbi:MAG TPA: hypothetical protein VF278_08475 [Pirellulales bacterium]